MERIARIILQSFKLPSLSNAHQLNRWELYRRATFTLWSSYPTDLNINVNKRNKYYFVIVNIISWKESPTLLFKLTKQEKHEYQRSHTSQAIKGLIIYSAISGSRVINSSAWTRFLPVRQVNEGSHVFSKPGRAYKVSHRVLTFAQSPYTQPYLLKGETTWVLSSTINSPSLPTS